MPNKSNTAILASAAIILFLGLASFAYAISVQNDFDFGGTYRIQNASTTTILGGLSVGTTTPQSAGVLYVGSTLKFGDGTSQTTAGASSVSAGQVSSGVFGSIAGKGNYTFQAAASAAPVLFVDATNERVGVGTTGPGAKFQINQTVGTNAGGIRIVNGSITTYLYGDAGGNVHFDNSGASLYLNENGGNVGIGTTGPTTKLFVQAAGTGASITASTANSAIRIKDTDGQAASKWGISWARADADYTIAAIEPEVASGWPAALKFFTNTDGATQITEKMRITSAGYVGIGTSTPASKLTVVDVNANLQFNNTGNNARLIIGHASNVYSDVLFSPFGTDQVRLRGSSYGLAIATTTAGNSAALNIGFPDANYGSGLFVNGNVGIATTTPLALLSVGNATTGLTAIFGGGSGKIDAGTIDPPYTIGGVRYATYLPSMTGVKEETAGVVKLEDGKYVLDFASPPRGSDLWLFYQTADFGKNMERVAVLLTPGFDGRAWYEKDVENNRIAIFAEPSQQHSPQEVSYRLTAPRFDWREWPNATGNSGGGGFVLDIKP